jgi:hypothetical protein
VCAEQRSDDNDNSIAFCLRLAWVGLREKTLINLSTFSQEAPAIFQDENMAQLHLT